MVARLTSLIRPAGLAVAAFVLVLFGGSAVASAAPSSFPQACTYGPCGGAAQLVVTSVHQSASGETTLGVAGSNYGSNEFVNLEVYPQGVFVGTVHAGPSGSFSNTVHLPGGIPAGHHTLVGTGVTSGKSASAPFTLAQATTGNYPCQPHATAAASSYSGMSPALAAASSSCPPSQMQTAGVAVPPAGPTAAASASSSPLPFTGTDAQLSAAAGAALIAVGGMFVLSARRRRQRNWQ